MGDSSSPTKGAWICHLREEPGQGWDAVTTDPAGGEGRVPPPWGPCQSHRLVARRGCTVDARQCFSRLSLEHALSIFVPGSTHIVPHIGVFPLNPLPSYWPNR